MSGVVAIVGRPNVGKSSLFNRIVGERVSITDDQSGITRDRIYSKATWLTREFKVIDTGGIILRDEPFSKEILAQATLAIDEADVIVMVVDVQTGITQEDIDVIDILHRSDKPVIVAVNKVDNVEIKDLMYEFYSLGCEYVMPISALHGIGVGDLLDLIVQLLPESKPIEKEENVICFSIIGQPNVGKSTLTNAILGEERVIVSDIPGTTRDAIDTRFTRNGKEYVVIDTAGIRKRGKIYERAEKYSIIRAINAIERSDIVVVLLDATRKIQEQDKRIVGYARAYNRGIILVVNKWDLVEKDDKTMNRYVEDIRNSLQFVDFAPIVFLSAKTKSRVHLLLDTIDKVYENFTKYVQTSTLNDVLHDAILLNQPPMYKGNRLKLSYATQSDVAPPTFVLFVNDETHMHFSYLRYLENQVRNTFDFSGSPIKFVLRKKE
ncbi:MAG: ribosome biogenesis GTPase Der [Acholeplasmataceae bacterium]|nr:ribosome biogenesis GTPase Der [Acholeplasmataceae bacterium]HPT89476.1 ribosome biogenesis GTPase Der [Bacilli bacterium]HQD92231.1 ribosome biogenesis GTPase Der [Bacilli bacterium]